MIRKTVFFFQNVLRLTKFKVSATVTLTTVTGYVMFCDRIDFRLMIILAGVFFLASAATALNQIQDRKRDALMSRTADRPLPARQMSVKAAFFVFLVTALSGLYMLGYAGGPVPFALGLFNLVWYNGVYTFLKRYSAFAVIPGSVVGAVPPLIGWTAAGGAVADIQILTVAAFLFIWQIPHFWLLMLRFSDDYKKGGFPVLQDRMSEQSIRILISFMMIITSASAVLLTVNQVLQAKLLIYITLCVSGIIASCGIYSMFSKKFSEKKLLLFILLNTCMMLLMASVIADNAVYFMGSIIYIK